MGSSREDLSSSWMAATQSGAVTFDLFGMLVPTFSMLELENGMATATQRTSAKMVSVCG